MTLQIDKLSFRINKKTIIENISLAFEPGIFYGILGPNGSGKTTLLKTMSRIWKSHTGKIFWHGQDLNAFSRKKLSQTLALVLQNPPLYFDYNIYEMTLMGRYPHGYDASKGREAVLNALQQMNAWHLRDQSFSTLSAGEKQRVYIARALATQAPVMLLDEPTSHLDLKHQLEILQMLKKLALEEGKVVIATIHDLSAAERFCDRIVVLNGGRCEAAGTYASIMTPELLRNTFGVEKDRQGMQFTPIRFETRSGS